MPILLALNTARTITYPPDLPVSARRAEILAAIRANPVVILAGETGSGKTTQLPKMCLEAGLDRTGRIGCTQPRRVAAMSVSRRVAEELGVQWGREVGCKIRFNDDTSRDTRIKFMTDGILLAEIQSDPLLRSYSTLILDEAHERSLNIDFLLGYLQGLLKKRPDLKLLITSATIDTEAFSAAFGGAPILQVSGRLYPVEIRYTPIETLTGEAEDDLTYVEASARAVENALIETDNGDILVFLPTERDIREAKEMLEGSLGREFEVLGLYGRMPAAEQQKIFLPGPKRRVVLATNVAETSLTIPRIGTVIDSGLARISRYTARTRTKRLPIEPISQSSANQRAGRAGRIQAGVCVRLYSEEDFEKRPRFTQPEIQRSNLAEVILRMKAHRLGEVETFPFINPPQPQAIRAGYLLLQELGALTEHKEHGWLLTPLGKELARLPVDPTLGRMLLQARQEGVLKEMLVIAAGLSVPDPRERPDDAKEAAATAHQTFAHPESDFLTLLNIWNAAPPLTDGSGVRTSRNAMRRFCKANFLSLTRMREWRDIYRQLEEVVRNDRHPAKHPTDLYTAIHRSILSGLIGHIAQREERNQYKAPGNRTVTIFPGSNLYERGQKKSKEAKAKQPEWIVAGEIVQTSQLFARNVARIEPEWVLDLAPHLCQHRHQHPAWSSRAGRVLVTERMLVYGLEVARRPIDYGRVNPEEATELFIRGALIGEEEDEEEERKHHRQPRPPRIHHAFFAANRKLRKRLENTLTKVRSHRIHDLDEAFYRFYAERIERVSSLHDLDKLVRSRITEDPNFLVATEDDILPKDDLATDPVAFPDQVVLNNTVLPLSYSYNPGAENDGVTVRVPLPLADKLSTGRLHWMIPGLREEQVGTLLRSLPKAYRKQLHPIEPKIKEIVAQLDPGDSDLVTALSNHIAKTWHVVIPREEWRDLPDYLRPRVQVVDRRNKTVAASRDLQAIRTAVDTTDISSGQAWDRAAKQWEQEGLTQWPKLSEEYHGTLPESVVVEQVRGAPLHAYPGLTLESDGRVALRLFRKPAEVEAAAPGAICKLAELTLAKDMAWLMKEIRVLGKLKPSASPAKGATSLQDVFSKLATPVPNSFEIKPETACIHIARHLFRLEPVLPLGEKRFLAMLEEAHRALPLLARKVINISEMLLEQRQAILASNKRYPTLEADLARLLPPDFLLHTPHPQLLHLPRYLKAIALRAERAAVNPAKDAEKARQLAPFADWKKRVAPENHEKFRWMLEEFRVSLFAQELGTAHPISAQRLQSLETNIH